MVSFEFDIPKYDWHVSCFVAVSHYNHGEIIGALEDVGASEHVISKASSNIKARRLDTGFTYSNKRKRCSVMVIGLASSSKEEMNSIVHEIRHLVDDISTTCNLIPCGEDVAYLSGDVAMMVYEKVKNLFCCKCHH